MQARTQVLVVGAGPVGLLAALCLRQRGLEVAIIDEAERQDAHSFGVVLHARTIAMLGDLGLSDPFVWRGQSFRRVAVFAGGERRAVLEVPPDGELSHGGLTLPQDVLRQALENALRTQGVEVQYQRRLESLEQDSREVRARIVELRLVSSRSGTPTVELLEAQSLDMTADFVVGADGETSRVRQSLDLRMLEHAPARPFAFFDVTHEAPSGQTIEVVLDTEASSMVPLHGGAARYSFELGAPPAHPLDAKSLRELRAARMPWHPAPVEPVEWYGLHAFRGAMVEHFGKGRVWLAGDAAHSTLPLGAQSFNVGLREARDVASALSECDGPAALARLPERYGAQRELEWRLLLGQREATRSASSPAWVHGHLRQLLAALPASGDDLDDLLAQLGVTVL